MEYNSVIGRSPKKEEQQVPDPDVFPISLPDSSTPHSNHNFRILDELGDDVLLASQHDHKESLQHHCYGDGQLNWDFMELEGFSAVDADESQVAEDDDEGEEEEEEEKQVKIIKTENNGSLWEDDDDYNMRSLKLNLNYQDVLDAWSDRGSLWADNSSILQPSNNGLCYMGEVPIMEGDRCRRNASVKRYKEKRQSRLFSKKIRYQVRKLNADKRPRLKGRFVKKRCNGRED